MKPHTRFAALAALVLAALASHAAPAAEKVDPTPSEPLVMVAVPEGSFLMGQPEATPSPRRVDEFPDRPIHLSAYTIARDEVTVGQWVEFLNEVGSWMAWHPLQPVDREGGRFSAAVDPDEPIRAVSWDAARAFCRWHGLDLPTEAQWERAARGPDAGAELTRFPWGDASPTCAQANVASGLARCHDGPLPVGSHPEGDSAEGVRDLIGNVSEWVLDHYAPYPEGPANDPGGPKNGRYRVIRGGSYLAHPDRARVSTRNYDTPDTFAVTIGFRCAGGAP